VSILVIFDEYFDPDRINEIPLDPTPIQLLPFTGNWQLIQEVQKKCSSKFHAEVSVLDAAHLVTEEARALRGRLGSWSERLGNKEVNGKNLKTWLHTSDHMASTFWFGPISEKNPLKTDLFLRIIQANIIFAHISQRKYSTCLVGVSNPYLKKSVVRMATQNGVGVIMLSSFKESRGVQDKIQQWCEGRGFLGQVILAIVIWTRFLVWKVQVGSSNQDQILDGEPGEHVMCVTYFPYVDWELARKGIFHNFYTGPLQRKFQELQLKVVWLLLYVTIDGKSYREAVNLKKHLVSCGERLFFLEEFVSFWSFITVLWEWVGQIYVSVWLNGKLSDQALCEGLCDATAAPIVRQLWMKTTCGPDAIKNLVYYESFKKIFSPKKHVSQCIYYCEMQGWEAALNAAGRKENPALKRIGHQHTAFSANFFPFQHLIEAVVPNGQATDFPLPHILACNGQSDYRVLSDIGYSSLRLVEAVRQLHVAESWTTKPTYKNKAGVLLVAGSIEYEETKAMVSLVASAYPVAEDFEIWFKGHPSLAFERILEDLGIDDQRTKYQIKVGRIEDFLWPAKAVIVPASTVAVEALAYGCEVIVPFSSESLPLSPLLGHEEFYHSVYEPNDLQKVMKTILTTSPQMTMEAKQGFVKNYWCLDPSLSRWQELLQEKNEVVPPVN